jgi:hypothetical protein
MRKYFVRSRTQTSMTSLMKTGGDERVTALYDVSIVDLDDEEAARIADCEEFDLFEDIRFALLLDDEVSVEWWRPATGVAPAAPSVWP